MARDILDAVYGSLIGGAIGDALGAPLETLSYRTIREKHGKLREFIPSDIGDGTGRTNSYAGQPGQITDDSAFTHYVALAIVRKGGRITPDDLAALWLEKGNARTFWLTEEMILAKLRFGMNPWETGKGLPPTGIGMMGVSPVGIVNAGNPSQAYQDGYVLAGINTEDLNRDLGGTMAAGVSAAFAPNATVESVLSAMTTHGSFLVRRAIDRTMAVARRSDSIDEFVERFYDRLLDWTWPWPHGWEDWTTAQDNFSGSAVEIVPVTMAMLYLTKGDLHEAIVEAANFGRDCESMASAAGRLLGAMYGASAFRRDWIDTVEHANHAYLQEIEGDEGASFESMARRLVAVLEGEQEAARKRVAVLDRIVG
jgi:ADP-ribosylglycohydrolase